jgi:DNA-binding FadR family transcriptional regulator
MQFEEISSQRLYQRVAAQVAGMIRSGELPPGERLPAERDLAMQLSVSRPVIREAMIALEIAGLAT